MFVWSVLSAEKNKALILDSKAGFLDSFSALEKTKTTTHEYKLNSPKFDKNRQNIYLNNLKKPKVYILDIFNIFTHQMLQKMAKVLHTDRSKTKEVPKKPEKNQNVFKSLNKLSIW